MANEEMTLQDIIADIHALYEDIGVYERKYGVLSETFYESYMSGEEPEDDSWILDWADWAGAYKILLRRQEQYRRTIQALRQQTPDLVSMIERTTKREPIPVASYLRRVCLHSQAAVPFDTTFDTGGCPPSEAFVGGETNRPPAR